ncbi:calcium-dependent protein kinase 8-like [Phoenix dactylifera]|uniref:Calcium-dependent protein kinase 8-like n=1 Tax=Phoenix dactylifera TaxID=42345 RepID=A0A8B8ZG61_PHODC|nr:calcium-dependent protein kinase 8-like [Phoenix dactylifera]
MVVEIPAEYEIGPEIGRGGSASCIDASRRRPARRLPSSPSRRPSSLTLLTASASSGRPRVPRLPHATQVHAVYEDEAWLHAVELCPGLDLFDRISRRVAHRGIKPDNVLYDERGHLKLVDLGSAECFEDGW